MAASPRAAITTSGQVPDAAVASIVAGIDMVYVPGEDDAIRKTHSALLSAVKKGTIPPSRLDEALTRAVVDLSGRPWLHFGVGFKAQRIGDLATELFEDFFWALVDHGRFNLHLDSIRGRNAHHIAETVFKATARALAMAVAKDPRVHDVPSTKGSL